MIVLPMVKNIGALFCLQGLKSVGLRGGGNKFQEGSWVRVQPNGGLNSRQQKSVNTSKAFPFQIKSSFCPLVGI